MSDPAEAFENLSIPALDGAGLRRRRGELAAILVDAVESGASVGFMKPFDEAEALRFWDGIAKGVEAGRIRLFAALLDRQAVGTVQLVLAIPPNQAHRADIAKLLVHRRARGIAKRLLAAAEREALGLGRTLLTLDTLVGTPADRLYQSLGYRRVGVVPDYARLPEGPLADTAIFYKRLGYRSRA